MFSPIDESLVNTALAQQPSLNPRHFARVAVVVETQQMQQAVQREHPQFSVLVMAGRARLPPGDASSNHNVAEVARRPALLGGRRSSGRKTQYISRRILTAIP